MIGTADEKLLRGFLERAVNIPDSEWERLRLILRFRELASGDYFVRGDEVASEIGFVLTGLLRKFYQTEDGREFIKDFSPERHLVAAYSSLLQNTPSRLSIQALEPTRLLVIPYVQLTSFYRGHSCWQELGRKIAESLFIEREQREFELLILPAKSRYEMFVGRYPGLLNRVPQYDIASYLGISPVSLSRLVGKKRSSGSMPKR